MKSVFMTLCLFQQLEPSRIRAAANAGGTKLSSEASRTFLNGLPGDAWTVIPATGVLVVATLTVDDVCSVQQPYADGAKIDRLFREDSNFTFWKDQPITTPEAGPVVWSWFLLAVASRTGAPDFRALIAVERRVEGDRLSSKVHGFSEQLAARMSLPVPRWPTPYRP